MTDETKISESEITKMVEEGRCDHEHNICTDEAHGRHSGICRGCGNFSTQLSNDDGWCSDCN